MINCLIEFPTQNSEKMKGYLPFLPSGIVEDILSRLPAKALLRFRCVNKQWETSLTSPFFIKKHFTHQAENPNMLIQFDYKDNYCLAPDGVFEKAVKLESSYIGPYFQTLIVGTANGLICLSHDLSLSIWNPATRERKTLPDPQIGSLNLGEEDSALGFGFNSVIKDYMVVRVVKLNDMDKVSSEIEVYTMRKNSWRRVGIYGYAFVNLSSRAIVNGSMHWSANREDNKKYELIVSFGMADEVLREVPLPDNADPNKIEHLYLSTFTGRLSMFVIDKDEFKMNFWVLKNSWENLFVVDYPFYPCGFLKNGELILEGDGSMAHTFTLVSYNLENRSFMEVEIGGVGRKSYLDVVPYVESLVPLMRANNSTRGQYPNGVKHSGEKEGQIETIVDEGVGHSGEMGGQIERPITTVVDEGEVIRELCHHFRIESGKKGIFVSNCRKASRHKYFQRIQLPGVRVQLPGHPNIF